ncbi:MAG: hypothetical protein J7605_19390 [Variovorax sp.]|nr:hypothetical protein [Variovorax sp.]
MVNPETFQHEAACGLRYSIHRITQMVEDKEFFFFIGKRESHRTRQEKAT